MKTLLEIFDVTNERDIINENFKKMETAFDRNGKNVKVYIPTKGKVGNKQTLKVEVSDFDEKKGKQLEIRNIEKAKKFVASCPFATPVYVALKTGILVSFIVKNRKEIGI